MEGTVCYIVGAGSFFGVVPPPGAGDLVLAADGGYASCRSAGLEPDLLIGDFDSLDGEPAGVPIIRVPVEKDDTDTMLALKEGLRRGYRVFRIYGGTGGRPDHTVANLQALLYAANRGGRAYLYGEGFVWTAFRDGELVICGAAGAVFSVFALGGRAEGVSIEGAKYPLRGAVLEPDFPLGVSNHFEKGPVRITAESGALVVGWEI